VIEAWLPGSSAGSTVKPPRMFLIPALLPGGIFTVLLEGLNLILLRNEMNSLCRALVSIYRCGLAFCHLHLSRKLLYA
jgi:hypothetical protein